MFVSTIYLHKKLIVCIERIVYVGYDYVFCAEKL